MASATLVYPLMKEPRPPIHRATKKGYSWKLGFRHTKFSKTELPEMPILRNQSAPSKLYLLLRLAHHQDWAVGMPNNRIRNASQKGPSYPTFSPAPYNHNPGVQLLSQVHNIRGGSSEPRVGLRDLAARLLYLLDLLL